MAERHAVRLGAQVVHPLDQRDHLLPLLLLGRSSRCRCGGSRWSAPPRATVSPSSSSTSRSTPCVLGCCGPMLTVIVSVRISGIEVVRGSTSSVKRVLDQLAHDVQQRPVHFLHPRGDRGRHVDVNRRRPADCAAIAPGQRDRSAVPSPCATSSAATTFGDAPLVLIPSATSPGAAERFDLPREHASNA